MAQTALKLKIEGMHCDACVRRVTLGLKKLPDVHTEHVSVGEARVAYDTATVQAQTIVDAVNAIGFHAEVAP